MIFCASLFPMPVKFRREKLHAARPRGVSQRHQVIGIGEAAEAAVAAVRAQVLALGAVPQAVGEVLAAAVRVQAEALVLAAVHAAAAAGAVASANLVACYLATVSA